MKKYLFVSVFSVCFIIGALSLNATGDSSMPEIYVNGTRLSEEKTLALQQAYGQIPTGRYWYDPVSGLWGVEGRSVVGQIRPGLDLGGSLKTNASNGNTGVFINGPFPFSPIR